MACNEVLTPPPNRSNPLPKLVTALVLKFFNPLPPSPQAFYFPLRLGKTASAFFTHGYFQQAPVHISEAIITD